MALLYVLSIGLVNFSFLNAKFIIFFLAIIINLEING